MPPGRPIRILHIVEATLTGVGQHVVDLLRCTDRTRFPAGLCYSLQRSDQRFRDAIAELQRAGIPFYEIPMYRWQNPSGNWRAVQRISRIIREQRYDLVHAHSAIGGMIGRLAAHRSQTPAVYTPNGWPFLSTGDRVLAGAYRMLEQLASRWCDGIICVSRHERELGIKHRIAPAEKFTIIPNGIDLTRIRGDRTAARQTLGLPLDAVVLGTLTRFAFQKDPIGIIRALAPVLKHNERSVLVMVGEGPLLAAAKAAARQQGIDRRVRFTGFRPDAAALLFAFDIFLLPSRYEGLSYAMLEAMAAGLPIVTTAGGGEEAVTHNDNGLIVPVGDQNALRAAAERLLFDAELRRRMGERSRTRVREFSLDQQLQRTQAVYDTIVRQHQV